MTLREMIKDIAAAHFDGCETCRSWRMQAAKHCSTYASYVRVLRDLREQERQGKPYVRLELGALGKRETSR